MPHSITTLGWYSTMPTHKGVHQRCSTPEGRSPPNIFTPRVAIRRERRLLGKVKRPAHANDRKVGSCQRPTDVDVRFSVSIARSRRSANRQFLTDRWY